MKRQLLLTSALAVIVGSAALAQGQSRSESTQQTPSRSENSAPLSAPNAQSQTPPAGNASGSSSSQSQAKPPSSTQGAATGNLPASDRAQQPNNNVRTNDTAQQPANSTTAQQPSSNSSTAQQPSNTNTAQQPAQTNNAQSNSNVNASVNINDQQRTRISQSVARLNVKPLTNVNFSLSVGTVVPRDIRFEPLPADIVEIVPQYRGYSFFMVRDEIVIIDPSSYQIVAVLPQSGGSRAAAPARSHQKVTFSDRDREAVRKYSRVSKEKRTVGGPAIQSQVRVGERLPRDVEFEEFPDEVYRDAPTLREYRYLRRENRTYVIEPHERLVIEEID